jgi:hypothetical protein
MLPKAMIRCKKNLFIRSFTKKDLMKIEEMTDIFLNLEIFVQQALLTLVPLSSLNLKAWIMVSKVSWKSQRSYEILKSSFERKFDKTIYISPKRHLLKAHCVLGLRSDFRTGSTVNKTWHVNCYKLLAR